MQRIHLSIVPPLPSIFGDHPAVPHVPYSPVLPLVASKVLRIWGVLLVHFELRVVFTQHGHTLAFPDFHIKGRTAVLTLLVVGKRGGRSLEDTCLFPVMAFLNFILAMQDLGRVPDLFDLQNPFLLSFHKGIL